MHSMTNSGMNLSVMPGNQVSLRWAVGNSRQGPEPREALVFCRIKSGGSLLRSWGRGVQEARRMANKRLPKDFWRGLGSNIASNIAICEVKCLTAVRHEPYRFKQNQEHQL